MPEIVRAMVFREPGRPLELHRLPLPRLGRGEVLVRVSCCTLCGSDVHSFHGRRSTPCPTVLGHEILGQVTALGPESPTCDDQGEPVAIGDRITWSVAAACGDCFFCGAGLPQKCERLFKYGHEPTSDRHPLSGGLAEYCHLAAGTAIFRVPPTLPDSVACPANCATATAAAAMRYAGPTTGRAVLVQGAGMLGLTAAAMSAAGGATEVIVSDRLNHRLRRAYDFGATQTASVDDGDGALRRIVVERTSSRGVDVAIDMSGDPAALESGMKLLRIGGRYVWVGAVFPERPVSISAETVVRRILSIQGVHNYVPEDLAAALRFLEEHCRRFPFDALVSETFALDQADAAFARASREDTLRVAVIP